MPDSPFIPRMDKTLHQCLQNEIGKYKKNIPSFLWEKAWMLPNKYKDQNDRIGEIYRLSGRWTHFQWQI